MQLSRAEAERIVRSGVAALQRGDAHAAAAAFGQVAAAGLANAQVWLLLAHANRTSGDTAAEEAALDALLGVEPGSLRGLIMKGDRRAAAGDARAATSFYKRGIAVAAGGEGLPDDLDREVARVQAWLNSADRVFREHLRDELARRGFGEGG